MYVAKLAQVWVISGIIPVTQLNALDDFLHDGVDTRFLMDFIDRPGFGYSMRYDKVYVLINLGGRILALAYRVSAHPVSRIVMAGLVPNCEIVCLQTQCPFLETCWQFRTLIVPNGIEWLVVSNNNKFTAVNVQMKMVNCPDNGQGFSVNLWVYLLCSWQCATGESCSGWRYIYKHNNYTQYKATRNTRLTWRVSESRELTSWRPLQRSWLAT